jgi:hypothetical protein
VKDRKRFMNRFSSIPVPVMLLAALLAIAQDDIPGRKVPSVVMSSVPTASVTRGKSSTVDLSFRVGSGFHINSNTPKSEFLIPTSLKLEAPTDIVVGVKYPNGEDRNFPFSPDEKLNVYTGDFTVAVSVRPLASVLPGKYVLRGNLKYQACDNAACYPPKQLPVQFEVKVVKAPPPPRKNPGQSPHIHT